MIINSRSLDYLIPAPHSEYFKDLHTVVIISTFPRSGSTLMGYLLTAHRNMVVASEPDYKEGNLYNQIPPMALFNFILFVDKMRFEEAKKVQNREGLEKENLIVNNVQKRTYNKQERYIFIPNQWQARCESLQVIGVKNSSRLARFFLDEDVFRKFKESLKKIGIRRLKFIFTVRNPYDMLTTGVIFRARNPKYPQLSKEEMLELLEKRIQHQSVVRCEISEKVFKLMDPKDIFLNRHEDLVHSPVTQLNKICDFLKVPALPDYLDDCASVVGKKPNKSRHELEWSDELKRMVEDLIEKYHFFSGYSWDS